MVTNFFKKCKTSINLLQKIQIIDKHLRRGQSNDDANRSTKQICQRKSKGYYINKSAMVKMFEFDSRKNKFWPTPSYANGDDDRL